MNQEHIIEQLENAYGDISTLLTKINEIDNIANRLDNVVKTFNKSYNELFDISKFKEFEKENRDVIKRVEADSQKISKTLESLSYFREVVSDDIQRFNQRISNYEDEIKKLKQTTGDVDYKLNKLLKEADKKQNQASRNVSTAFKLLQADNDLENYDELLKIQKENNVLLKELNKKLSVQKTPNSYKGNNRKDKMIPKNNSTKKIDLNELRK